MKAALTYLRAREWDMGSGQCHTCHAWQPRKGHDTDRVGHERGCKLAEAILSIGGKVEWDRKNHSKKWAAKKKAFEQMMSPYIEEMKRDDDKIMRMMLGLPQKK